MFKLDLLVPVAIQVNSKMAAVTFKQDLEAAILNISWTWKFLLFQQKRKYYTRVA